MSEQEPPIIPPWAIAALAAFAIAAIGLQIFWLLQDARPAPVFG